MVFWNTLESGGLKAAFKSLAKEGAEVVAKQSVKKEIIHLDANALIGAIEKGMAQDVDRLLIDKIPSVSRQAVREFLVKGDKNLLRSFLTERGGRLARSGSEAQINSLLQFASKTGRKVGLGDAKVAASALRENAAIITNDKRFFRFLNEVGVRNFQF